VAENPKFQINNRKLQLLNKNKFRSCRKENQGKFSVKISLAFEIGISVLRVKKWKIGNFYFFMRPFYNQHLQEPVGYHK